MRRTAARCRAAFQGKRQVLSYRIDQFGPPASNRPCERSTSLLFVKIVDGKEAGIGAGKEVGVGAAKEVWVGPGKEVGIRPRRRESGWPRRRVSREWGGVEAGVPLRRSCFGVMCGHDPCSTEQVVRQEQPVNQQQTSRRRGRMGGEAGAVVQTGLQGVGGHRRAEQVALQGAVRDELLEAGEFLGAFDAFGDGVESESAGEGEDGVDDGLGDRLVGQALDEAAVDLDLVEGQGVQVGE